MAVFPPANLVEEAMLLQPIINYGRQNIYHRLVADSSGTDVHKQRLRSKYFHWKCRLEDDRHAADPASKSAYAANDE